MSGSVSFETHFDFSALPLVMVREAFARLENGQRVVYAGVQHSSWARDEAVWNSRSGRYGGFSKFVFFRGVPHDLSVEGAALELLPNPLCPDDEVARLPEGTVLRASCYAQYQDALASQFRLYDSAGGFIERLAGAASDTTIATALFGLLAPGSYALWVRLATSVEIDTDNYTGTISPDNPELAWGEWALLRVQVGSSTWTMNPQVVASPGCPLYGKTISVSASTTEVTPQNEGSWRVPFDLAARSVSASCVLHSEILCFDGSVDVPKGSQIIAGLRASRNGPQSAIWVLNEERTARLLAISDNFSHGQCECGKADHHASDVVQGPDKLLYLLSECSLHRYAPDTATLSERLTRFPGATDGHPGGQCLRFPGNGQEVAFWTENLTNGVDDGASWYNRLVRRVGGRDQKGISSWWHGPNCAETYLGRFWALRGEPAENSSSDDERTESATIYLDWVENGRWHGFTGLQRPAQTHRWQRLRAVGNELWVFGFSPATRDTEGEVVMPDSPLAAWSDGKVLREVSVPFFVRRATTCELEDSLALFLTTTQAVQGIGPATHVVEVRSPRESSSICSFWNDEEGAFLLSRTEWEAAGHQVDELPEFLLWQPQSGRNAGGVWRASLLPPEDGPYLERDMTETTIRFVARGGYMTTTTLLLEIGTVLLTESKTYLDIE